MHALWLLQWFHIYIYYFIGHLTSPISNVSHVEGTLDHPTLSSQRSRASSASSEPRPCLGDARHQLVGPGKFRASPSYPSFHFFSLMQWTSSSQWPLQSWAMVAEGILGITWQDKNPSWQGEYGHCSFRVSRLIKPHPSGEKSIANCENLPRIRQNRFKGPEVKKFGKKNWSMRLWRFSRWMLRQFWISYATFSGRSLSSVVLIDPNRLKRWTWWLSYKLPL